MSFQDLRSRLLQHSIPNKLSLDASLVGSDSTVKLWQSTLGIQSITVMPARITEQDGKVIISGKASLLNILEAPVEITVADDHGQLNLRLTANLPDVWTFAQSFPTLSPYFNYDSLNYGYKPSYLNEISFSKPAFVLTTHPFKDFDSGVQHDRGLNFIAYMDPLGLFPEWKLLTGSQASIRIYGLISSDTPAKEFCLCAQIPLGLGDDANFLKFENIQIKLWNSLVKNHPVAARIEVSTQLKIADKTLEIFSPLRIGAPLDFLVIGGRFSEIPLPDLSQLSYLVGGNDLQASVPPALKSLGGLTIEEIVTGFSLTNSELAYVRASIRTTDSWTIIPNLFQINKLSLTWLVQSPFNSNQRRLSCELAGQFQIADVPFNLYAEWPDFYMSGGLALGSTIRLGALLKHFIPDIPAPDDSLVITELLLLIDPTSKTYQIDARVENIWSFTIDQATFAIDSLALSLAKTTDRLSGFLEGVLSFEFAGHAEDYLTLDLKAELPASSASGWQFTGQTGKDQNIPISELIIWLGQRFGSTPTPSTLNEFTIVNLGLKFNTHSKDFFFTCAGNIKLPGLEKPLKATITIDIRYQNDESFTKTFAGILIIDGLEFDLLFESSHQSGGKDTKTFVASYYDDKGHTIEIGQLLQAINPKAPSLALGVNLKDALFAYQQLDDGGKNPSKFLLGVDIDAGLNLSDLKLPDLPLIGQPFPPGQTLKLALQVLYANQAFDKNELDRIGHLSSKGFKLPQQPVDQLKLVALLKIGQETKTLDLPIGIDKDNKQLEEIKKSLADTVPGNAAVAATTGFTKWIKIQKTFGPIHVERLGVGVDNGNLVLLLDSTLSAAGLSLSLDGLGAEFTLKDLSSKTFKPYFHLNGLGLDYKNGPLEIGGSFLKQQNEGGTSFAGLAIIRTTKLSLSAIGSYMQNKNGEPSLFVYAVANYPLGGPSFFFVTGFAAGFGYNRALTLPPIDEVASFPLVAEAVANGGPENLPTGQKKQQTALTEKLKNLEKFLPPSAGEIFVAAGIKFTSFKQIDSFALLALKFGRHFEIDLLGYSTLTAPPPETGKQLAPLAQAHLALKASFVPDEGFLAVRAQLTPNSYIFSTNCLLSGGFAFYSWFDPHPNAGDFVLTLGGYHSKFIVPEHYPKVPRLAINWQVSSELHVKADAYFALTGSALMAGGHLQVVYQHDKLKAWFNAGADFIVAWQPYYYEAAVYVDIGVSYSFEIFGNHTVTADLGANLHLWGPEFCGQATVHWSIISFTVKFGEQTTQQLKPISWTDFQTAFLPKLDQVCAISVNKGLIRQLSDEATKTPYWIINAKELMLSVQTIIPFNPTGNLPTYLQLADKSGKLTNQPAIAAMGLKASELTSQLSIAIKHNKILLKDRETFRLTPILKAMPAGLWGEPQFSKKDSELLDLPDVNKPQLIDNMLVGFEITPIQLTQTPNNSCTMNIAVLQDQLHPLDIALTWQDFSLSKRDAQDKEEKDPCGNAAWQAAKDALSTKSDNQAKLFAALGIVNAVVDYGEPINQAQVKTA